MTCDDGSKYTITKNDAQDIYFQLRTKNYITKEGEVTEIFRKACADENWNR